MLTDTHCHLYLPDFDQDRENVIRKAIESGVTKILIPGIDVLTSGQAIKLCSCFPKSLFAAVGIHPNSMISHNNKIINQIKSLAHLDCVVAIGEIGLDYYREKTSRSQQLDLFLAQLEIASDLSLPVCIHNREADQDICFYIKKWVNDLKLRNSPISNNPGVMHSFTGSLELALEFIQMGFYLGIGGPITYKKNQTFRDFLPTLPLKNILLETDSPYLPPQPFRGQRNEPLHLSLIAKTIADCYKDKIDNIAEITSLNSKNCFHWK